MFDTLSDRFEGIFKKLRGRGRLSDKDVDEVLREIRVALLEADVNLTVVRSIVARSTQISRSSSSFSKNSPPHSGVRHFASPTHPSRPLSC